MDVFSLPRLNQKLKTLLAFFLRPSVFAVVAGLLVVTVTIQAYVTPAFVGDPGEGQYTAYNNYVIFKYSARNLVAGNTLYNWEPEIYWDYYKYSPTFALAFIPLAWLPDVVGLFLWNLINTVPLLLGLWYLPWLSTSRKVALGWMVLPELMTNLQSTQSNGLMAGFFLLAFALLERRRFGWAALLLVASVYLKVFGLVAMALYLLYKPQWKSALWTAFFLVLLFLAPLMVVSPGLLTQHYLDWLNLLAQDAAGTLHGSLPHPLGAAEWLKTWFGFTPSNAALVGTGVLLFLLPWVRISRYFLYPYRLLALASVLMWVVIFNHKAESPTFVLAVAGAAVWLAARPRISWRMVLMGMVVVFTSLSTTDLFPAVVRREFFEPYAVKVVPIVVVWVCCIAEMLLAPLSNERAEPVLTL